MGLTLKLSRERAEHVPGLEGAGAARPARVGLVPLRQHGRQRALQCLARSDPHQRVAADRLEQRQRDDAHGHARRVRARHVRHLVARLPDVHRGARTTASAACTRRTATAAAPTRRSARSRPTRRRAPGSGRTRRSRACAGRCATTTTTSRPASSSRSTTSRTTAIYFLRNFYDKSKRSVLKAKVEGPAAYVLPANDPRLGAQAELLRVLQKQGVEISRATAAFTVTLPVRPAAAAGVAGAADEAVVEAAVSPAAAGHAPGARGRRPRRRRPAGEPPHPETREFPAGSYIVRMDQPYSRIADALLDYQYWAPNDAQSAAVRRHRLDVPRGFRRAGRSHHRREGARRPDGARQGRREGPERRRRPGRGRSRSTTTRDNALITLRYRTEERGHLRWPRSRSRPPARSSTAASFLIQGVPQADLDKVDRDSA